MYLVDRISNKIENLRQPSFLELGFKERQHLQEWLESNPESLGEELLVIQKEFRGFNETNERLDLLALDKNGNLIIIENKLDDTGRDVTWQALKYASYCSTLTKEQIRNIYQLHLDKKGEGEDATAKLCDFYDNTEYNELILNSPQTQRIILVAAKFRKEVTSTVLWLLAHKLRIQCFKVTLHAMDDRVFLSVEQIIPIKDSEDYIISMADKAQEEASTEELLREIHQLRLEFWIKPLLLIKGKSPIFQNTNPTKDHWLSAGGTGISGLSYSFVLTKTQPSIELTISRFNKDQNKYIFDALMNFKEEIERKFGHPLSWQRLDNRKMSRIAFYAAGSSFLARENWTSISEFLVNNMIQFETALREPLKKVKQQLFSEGDTE